MAYLVGLFLLATFVNLSVQQGAQPITLAQNTATISASSGQAPTVSFSVPLLAGPAQLSFQASANMKICLQRGLQVSGDLTTWNKTCLIYQVYQTTSGQATYSLPLKEFAHQMSFWFLNDTTATTAAVNFTLTGSQCSGNGVGSECVTPLALTTSANGVQVTSAADVTYFRIEAANVARAARLSFSFQLSNDSTLSAPVAASFGAVPTFLSADFNDIQSFISVSPSPMTWIILVNNQKQSFTYNFNIQTCDSGLGYYCNTTVTDVTSMVVSKMITTPSILGQVSYFKYSVNSMNKDLDLNVQTLNRGPNGNIRIFAKFGNLPTVSNANGYDYVDNDNTFTSNFLVEGDWYFAVQSENTFGLWLGDGCPNRCNAPNGKCNAATRTCSCGTEFFLIDCSSSVTNVGDVLPSERGALYGVGFGGLGAIALAIGVYYFIEYSKKREQERMSLFAHELPERTQDSERLDEHSY